MNEASASDPDEGGTSPRSDRLWRLGGWAALLLAATALAVAGMVGGWRLAGPVESETELGRVSFEVAADTSFGRVDAYVPIADWGIRANAFDAPFELDVEIRSLDRPGALEAAGGAREAIEATREDLEGSARSAVIRGFAWGLGTTLAVAFVLWLLRSRSRRFGLAAAWVAGTGVVGTAACLLLATLTFDARAFSSPSYYGRGPELAQLLAFFERQQDNDRYTSTFENALSNFSAYLAESHRVGEGEDRAIFFGSDLHSNFAILSALTTFVGEQPFILAGDFGTAGTEAEARLVSPRLTALSDQVVAVLETTTQTSCWKRSPRTGSASSEPMVSSERTACTRTQGSYRWTASKSPPFLIPWSGAAPTPALLSVSSPFRSWRTVRSSRPKRRRSL